MRTLSFFSSLSHLALVYGSKKKSSCLKFSLQFSNFSNSFEPRHNSLNDADIAEMLKITGFSSMDALIDATVPKSIRRPAMDLGEYDQGYTESAFLDMFKKMAQKNKVHKSFIGMGYYNTHLPPVILRNLLENPGWYTQYTPYQVRGLAETIWRGQLELWDENLLSVVRNA